MTVVTFGEVQQEEVKVVHKIGNWYKDTDSGGLYILAKVESTKVGLIKVGTGDRWIDPVEVRNPHQLSSSEASAIFCDYFTLVPSINIQEV